MMILLVSFVTSSLKTGWKSEVDYFLIHGCKGRGLFRNSEVGFRIFLSFLSELEFFEFIEWSEF
jgi:hypothetical protein